MSQRDDLLAGAKRCLVEKGYGGTTARDIAAASGAHLASIGYHFGSKDQLMNTAVLEALSEWGDEVEAVARATGGEDAPQRFAALLDALLVAIPRHRDLHGASVQACARALFDADLREEIARGYREGRGSLASIVAGRASGEETPADRALGSFLHALVTGYVVQALIDPEAVPGAADVVAAIERLVPGHGGAAPP